MENYFIKDGYKINPLNVTSDSVSGGNYWNKQRLIAAEYYQEPVYRFASEFIKKRGISTMIDVGCGVGVKLSQVVNDNPNLLVCGVDQEHPIEFCKKNHKFGEWLVDDFERPKYTGRTYDLILCSDVIEHVVDPDRLLSYLHSLMNKNSYLIISTPDRDAFRGVNCFRSPNIHHIREWNQQEFREYITSRGFSVEEHFLQYPVKMKIGSIFYKEIIKRAVLFKPLKYNQVLVAKVV
jgi:2-polyprenyl-3-methyl-5-hydroxy-6-metoxy-1,4-benzoquinol methylase